jgi:hypothetical protein
MPQVKILSTFKDAHIHEYGLYITERHPKTSVVISVRCQFCVYFEKEDRNPEKVRKRKKTDAIMTWQTNFRVDLYQHHHLEQHYWTWERYKLCSYDERTKFFDGVIPFKSTIPHHFAHSGLGTTLSYTIHAPIVDVILLQMFFSPTEQGGTLQQRLANLFKRNSESLDYVVTIPNSIQFRLCIAQIAQGCSFRQVAGGLMSVKSIAGVSAIGSITDMVVANYVRIVCAINLQRLMAILNQNASIWAFSLANDASTHYGSSYLDNRIRFHLHGKLYDIHAIAIPMFERHTGLNMYRLVTKFLDIVCPSWRNKLLGLAADGASVMTGEFKGVITRLEKDIPHKVYRIWCGLHQLDLVMKHGFEGIMEGTFVTMLSKFVSQCREQLKMQAIMECVCPNLTTRWVVMGKAHHSFKGYSCKGGKVATRQMASNRQL